MVTTAHNNDRMGVEGMNKDARWWNRLRLVGWSMAAFILVAPLVAMLFTEEVNWGPMDFLFAAFVVGGSGLLFELGIRRSTDNAYRTGIVVGLAATFFLVWSNAAVGFVGSGANTANVLYLALLAVPFISGFVTGFHARGLLGTMVLTAVVQVAITAFVFATGLVAEEERMIILAINAIFLLLWSGAAMLFRQAAEREAAVTVVTSVAAKRGQWAHIQFVLSILMCAIGAILLVAMVTVESEPGALPLVMVVMGLTWFFITLFRSRSVQGK